MIKLSASLIKDYLTCPKRAYYRINFPQESVQTPEMALGSATHSLIEKYWDNEEKAYGEIDTILHKYNAYAPKYEKMLKGFLDIFFLKFKYFVDKNDFIEKFFSVGFGRGVNVVGKFDRIHKNTVFDWKTSAKLYNSVDRDVQFIIYYLAYNKVFGIFPDTVFYASLSNGNLYEFKPDPVIIDDFNNSLLPKVLEGLRGKEFPRNGFYNYSSYVCDKCTFKDFCFKELFGVNK